MDFSPVLPGLFTCTLDTESTTAVLVVGETGSLLVDTGSTPQVGTELRQAAESVTCVPLQTVILTHAHWDHCFGLSAFTDLDTIGHEDLPTDILCEENQAWARTQGLDCATLPVPTTSLTSIGVRNLGNLVVEIAHFGPAHSRTDLIVAIPQYKAIIVGDLVDTAPPQFDETSNLDGWVRSLDSLYALLKHDTLIIPGHTDNRSTLNAPQVAHFRAGLAGIWDQAEWAFHRGIPVDEVYDHDNLQWPWDRTTVQKGISLAYAELASS